MTRESCRALLIDLDGVLRRFAPERQARIERECGLPAGMILDIAFQPDRLRPVVTGRVSDADWRAGVVDAIATALDDRSAAQRAVDGWSAYPGEVVPEVLAAIRGLRAAGVPVALGTNGTDRVEADLAALGLTGEFDAVLNSAALGHAKPSPEFYAAACAALDVPARLCLLVDDGERQVRGGRAAGLAALRYTGIDDLHYVRAALAAEAA